ncbi:MAG: LapA family protein [Alphaproteobacteria bacterium]|nr:MAG: LapA family protein [Alphaproteobacteria bacterium]
MRYLRYAFLGGLAVVLITVALANRDSVTLNLLPQELSGFLGFSWQVQLPLFVVIFLGIIAGIVIGFVWEWMREYKFRAKAKRAEKAAVKLSEEVQSLRRKNAAPGDDVLALLDEAPRGAR